MVSKVEAYLGRAENNIVLAKHLYELSTHACMREDMNLKEDMTFLGDVVSLSYYSIFYAAKAYTISNGSRGTAKTVHADTYEMLEKELYSKGFGAKTKEVYEALMIDSRKLLDIFINEKNKRGSYTYNPMSKAKLRNAKASIENAEIFLISIKYLLENNPLWDIAR
jgi:uncharacterized protein (UPF0332 family)